MEEINLGVPVNILLDSFIAEDFLCTNNWIGRLTLVPGSRWLASFYVMLASSFIELSSSHSEKNLSGDKPFLYGYNHYSNYL